MVTSVIEGYDRTTTSREPRFLIGVVERRRMTSSATDDSLPHRRSDR
jgi:hypothetical protein